MQALYKKFNIDTTFQRRQPKDKIFNHVWDQIPHLDNYNYEADLLMLPEYSKGFKYLFVVTDLASDDFDIEPLKAKTSEEVLTAYKKMLTRNYIGIPIGSIRTDGGNEFQGVFNKFLLEHHVDHRVGLANRHKQQCVVENLNKTLSKLFNGYLNHIEEKTGKTFNDWTDIINQVRTGLNKIRHINLSSTVDLDDYPVFNIEDAGQPKYKEGDIVYEKLDQPQNAFGKTQPTNNFRIGDYTYSKIPKKVIRVLYMRSYPWYRYLLKGLSNVSYSESELMKSSEDVEKQAIKKIIKKRVVNKLNQYLVWFKGDLRKDAIWQTQEDLLKDITLPEIKTLLRA